MISERDFDEILSRIETKAEEAVAAHRRERKLRVALEADNERLRFCMRSNFANRSCKWADFEAAAAKKLGPRWKTEFISQCGITWQKFKKWEEEDFVPGEYRVLIDTLEGADGDDHPYENEEMIRALFKITKGQLPTRGRKSRNQDSYDKIAEKMNNLLPERQWTKNRIMSLTRSAAWRAMVA